MNDAPTHPHPLSVGWTRWLNDLARAEGWEVGWSFHAKKYTVLLVATDRFGSEAHTLDFVKRCAARGDPLCIKALAVIVQCNLLA